jgi:pimeloyl-ACP methyl ester carboxylesterase
VVDPLIHVETLGGGRAEPVVLVHGTPDRSTSLVPLAPLLEGHPVTVYDRRGYGWSLGAAPAGPMVDHARDLLDILGGFDSPPVVVAHSFGSNPALLAATLRPEAFAALGVWEPPLPWTDEWPEHTKEYLRDIVAQPDPRPVVERMYRQMIGDSGWDRMAPTMRDLVLDESLAFQRDMASELAAPFGFADVRVPTLVGYGTATTGGHVEGAVYLDARLPDSRLYEIVGVGHFCHRTHPEKYAEFVRATVELARGVRR